MKIDHCHYPSHRRTLTPRQPVSAKTAVELVIAQGASYFRTAVRYGFRGLEGGGSQVESPTGRLPLEFHVDFVGGDSYCMYGALRGELDKECGRDNFVSVKRRLPVGNIPQRQRAQMQLEGTSLRTRRRRLERLRTRGGRMIHWRSTRLEAEG